MPRAVLHQWCHANMAVTVEVCYFGPQIVSTISNRVTLSLSEGAQIHSENFVGCKVRHNNKKWDWGMAGHNSIRFVKLMQDV